LWNTISCANISIIKVPGEERQKKADKVAGREQARAKGGIKIHQCLAECPPGTREI